MSESEVIAADVDPMRLRSPGHAAATTFTVDDDEPIEHVGVWARRSWFFNRFRNASIEAAYQRYASVLWITHCLKWLVCSACFLTVGPALDLFLYLINIDDHRVGFSHAPPEWFFAHETFRIHFIRLFAAGFWLLALAVALILRFGSKTMQVLLAHQQQLILGSISIAGVLVATCPILTSSDADILAGYHGTRIDYSEGRWHMAVASVAAVGYRIAFQPAPLASQTRLHARFNERAAAC